MVVRCYFFFNLKQKKSFQDTVQATRKLVIINQNFFQEMQKIFSKSILPSGEQNSWKHSRSIVRNSLSNLGLSNNGDKDLEFIKKVYSFIMKQSQ